jgi:hypothetical protein
MSEKFNTYLCEYEHDGEIWSIEIKAASERDARRRLERLPMARILGAVQARFFAPKRASVFAKVYCWFRNLRFS